MTTAMMTAKTTMMGTMTTDRKNKKFFPATPVFPSGPYYDGVTDYEDREDDGGDDDDGDRDDDGDDDGDDDRDDDGDGEDDDD